MDVPRFPLGRLLATPAALAALQLAAVEPLVLVARHQRGDWGDLSRDDWNANERALRDDSRLLSAYVVADAVRVWIITEADRSATTILLPSDY